MHPHHELTIRGRRAAFLQCLPEGSAADERPLVLVQHGFPDHPHSFLPLLKTLANAGYWAVAPFLRGYAPSAAAVDGCYDLVELGRDLLDLIQALGADRASIIGHDWGAIAAYAAAALDPSRIDRLIALAVPPLSIFLKNLPSDRRQLRRSWYIGLFQLPGLAERRLKADNYALIDRLWRDWSPGLPIDPERSDALRRLFAAPGVAAAALAYYRHLFPRHPASFRRSLALAHRPLTVPALVLAGEDDGCIGPRLFHGSAAASRVPLTLEILPGRGHFLHLEAPAQLHARALAFLRA
jgi:pimeloyl-ACP methyl ester carboxylesterase